MPTVTRKAYRQALCDRLFVGRDARRGTGSASGSTTTLVDVDAFASSLGLTSKHVGDWIVLNTGGTVESAIITAVSAGGTATLDRAVTSTTNATTWEMTYNYHPDVLHNVINQVLRNVYTPTLFPLASYILDNDDNDMEDSGVTAWTDVNATSTKGTTNVFPTGAQDLVVTDSGAGGGYSRCGAHRVYASHGYHAFSVAHTIGTTTATMSVYDVTNAATIDSATTNELQFTWLKVQFSTPSGCESVQVRHTTDTASGVTHWKDTSLVSDDQRIFTCPSWLVMPTQMIDVVQMREGNSLDGTDDYAVLQQNLISVPWRPAWGNIRGANEVAIEVDGFTGSPRYIYAMRPGTALSSDTATGYVDTDVVVENALFLLDPSVPDIRKNRRLRDLREMSLRSAVSTPQKVGMAYFGR